MSGAFPIRTARACLLFALLVLVANVAAQQTPDQAADLILNSARKAYNEKNLPFAATRFREFLNRFGGHQSAPSARYGLALCLLDGAPKNYAEARDLLQPLVANKALPEHAGILYHLGLALRGLGIAELAQADARPQEAPQRRNAAHQRFEEATRHFAAARAAYAAKAPKVPADAAALPLDWEWAARARCDQAEMQLRLLKAKEARTTAAPFLRDPALTKSHYRDLGRYYYGFASFLLKDYPKAEATLSMLAPFGDPTFGTHARYLLARTHHLADERAEAALHYAGVLSDYARNKKAAAEALKRPDLLQKDPAEKARVEALVKEPMPDHVLRSGFYLGVLQYEGGRFGEARTRFTEYLKLYPKSPLAHEAEFRLGLCLVQLKEWSEAEKILRPLVNKDRRLSDQALFWLGKTRVGSAPDPHTNFPAFATAVREALDLFRQAADRAGQLVATDPEAKHRRAEILLEIADTQQLVKQPREAVAIYNQILNEKLLPQREEEINQRLITALHLAGDYNESDKAVQRFRERFPKSTLLPAVLFRNAENSYFRTLAAEKNPNAQERARQLSALYDETAKRYQAVIERYPEFAQINLARYGLAMTLYRKGELEKARAAFAAIPEGERNGELAAVPYVIADCLLRLAPAGVPEDALETGKLEAKLKSAAGLLDGYLSAHPQGKRAGDALLKLGHCQQRMAALQGQPPERNKLLTAARSTYDKLLAQPFANHPAQPQARIERAKCLAQLGDMGGAVNQLREFTRDPLQKSAVAPVALVQLATLLRAQKNPAEAVNVLAKGRQLYEQDLLRDPQRAGWAALLQYHHGIALREAGKLAEARAVFEQLTRQAPDRPESLEAGLRWGQCLKDEGALKLAQADKQIVAAKRPEETSAALKLRDDGLRLLRDALRHLEGHADRLKQKQPAGDVRARTLYEIAWGYRELARPEVEAARTTLEQAQLKRLGKQGAKFGTPHVPLKNVPLQPSEQKARAVYRTLIDDFAELPLSTEARFELAELLAQRGKDDDAVKLLTEGLDKEPPPELTAKIRLRLGACKAASGDMKAALAQFNAVAQDPKSPLAGQAHYRAGECLLQAKDWPEAIKRLSLFRDNGQFQNLPGVTDRALLRLGHAYAHIKDWERSRQAHEQAAGRFPSGPWIHEARYGVGWALQQMKQYDQAVNVYNQVTGGTVTETAAKAQLQIGLCRLEQKRYAEAAAALLVVPFTYDYKEYSAVALLEAARALTEMKQGEQAARLLRRLLRDHPQTPWAEAAQERLERLNGS